MRIVLILAVLFLTILPVWSQQGNTNISQLYWGVMSGKIPFSSLTPQQQRQVLYLYSVTHQQTKSNGTSECNSALSTAKSRADDLASYAKRLKDCAESGDLKDDCSSEYSRVKSSYSDYESASSEVESECDN